MDRYAVIGNPVEHSQSPRIHGLFAEQTGQAMIYERVLAPLSGFAAAVQGFFSAGGKGLNVTVPFKEEAAAWVSALDAEAAAAGAVNTITLAGDRVAEGATRVGGDSGPPLLTKGFNTDGPGLVRDLRANHGQKLEGARVLILGAGGAVRGVLRPLLRERPASLVIANRTEAKAAELAAALNDGGLPARVGTEVRGTGLHGLDGGYDLVISGTSAGLAGGSMDLPGSVARGAFCYDMIYGGTTDFCRWALDNGASSAQDGIGMLVEQAALAFEIWRGVAPRTAPVLERLRQERVSAGDQSCSSEATGDR